MIESINESSKRDERRVYGAKIEVEVSRSSVTVRRINLQRTKGPSFERGRVEGVSTILALFPCNPPFSRIYIEFIITQCPRGYYEHG